MIRGSSNLKPTRHYAIKKLFILSSSKSAIFILKPIHITYTRVQYHSVNNTPSELLQAE